jgi:hypothetical protein
MQIIIFLPVYNMNKIQKCYVFYYGDLILQSAGFHSVSLCSITHFENAINSSFIHNKETEDEQCTLLIHCNVSVLPLLKGKEKKDKYESKRVF